MFIPLHDSVALRHIRRARATALILAATVLLHFLISSELFAPRGKIDLGFGLIPAVFFGSAILGPDILHVPAWLTPVTSIFIHGSFWHLAGNMLFLWVFGDNVEDAMGHWRFAAFYLLCGAGAGVAFALIYPASQSSLIGASGAISGVAVAYLLMYPRARIVGLLLNVLPVSISAATILGLWVAYQVISALLIHNSAVGWWAHVGGIAAGALLLGAFKRHEVPLFGNRTE